jgi:hypothetical protein
MEWQKPQMKKRVATIRNANRRGLRDFIGGDGRRLLIYGQDGFAGVVQIGFFKRRQ